jgi:hypothetical protein
LYGISEGNCAKLKGKRGGRKRKEREMNKKYKEEKTQTKTTGTQYQLVGSLGGRLNRSGHETFSDRNNNQNWLRAYTCPK